MDAMVERFGYGQKSLVVEIASNDGYLLQHFKAKDVPVLGIEPTKNTANVAILKGIPTIIEYFGSDFANKFIQSGQKANLLIGNNVLAHVPDIGDFKDVEVIEVLVKSGDTIVFESATAVGFNVALPQATSTGKREKSTMHPSRL